MVIARHVPMPPLIDQLRQYQDARRIAAAIELVDYAFEHIMPSNEREMAAADAAKRIIDSRPLRRWTIADVMRGMKTTSTRRVRFAIAYLVLEGDAVVHVSNDRWGFRATYCHPDYCDLEST